MTLNIKDSHFENCGTGIAAFGNVDINMESTSFKNNDKDLILSVESESQIFIEKMTTTGCKTESITYEEYSSKLSNIEGFVENQTEYFSPDEITKIKILLDNMKDKKEKATLTKDIWNGLFQIGKPVATDLLLTFIKKQFGM